MTQPAVTFQVRQLEEDFNTRLFDRAHNRISLTPAGELVYQYSDRILDVYREMNEAVKAMTGDQTGLITIGASTTIAEYMLPGLLGDFQRSFPDVAVRLRVANTDAIVALVENAVIDLGVVEGAVNNQMLLVEDCQMDELVVIATKGHALDGQQSVSPVALTEYPFILREEGSGTRSVIAHYLRAQGLDESQLNCPFELGSTEAIKGSVEAGMGISIVSSATIAKERQLNSLVALPLNPPLSREFSFVRQRQKFRTHLMDELFQFARAYCGEKSRQADQQPAAR